MLCSYSVHFVICFSFVGCSSQIKKERIIWTKFLPCYCHCFWLLLTDPTHSAKFTSTVTHKCTRTYFRMNTFINLIFTHKIMTFHHSWHICSADGGRRSHGAAVAALIHSPGRNCRRKRKRRFFTACHTTPTLDLFSSQLMCWQAWRINHVAGSSPLCTYFLMGL